VTTRPISQTQSYQTVIGGLLLTIFALFSYIGSIAPHSDLFSNVHPSETAAMPCRTFWLSLVSMAQNDWWSAFIYVFSEPNEYFVGSITTLFFSPVTFAEDFSLYLPLFILHALATLLFYRLGLKLGLSPILSFLPALLYWLYPFNYNPASSLSLSALGTDNVIRPLFHGALALTLEVIFTASSTGTVLLAGMVTGLAFLATGGALTIVPIIFLCLMGAFWYRASDGPWRSYGHPALYTTGAVGLSAWYLFARTEAKSLICTAPTAPPLGDPAVLLETLLRYPAGGQVFSSMGLLVGLIALAFLLMISLCAILAVDRWRTGLENPYPYLGFLTMTAGLLMLGAGVMVIFISDVSAPALVFHSFVSASCLLLITAFYRLQSKIRCAAPGWVAFVVVIAALLFSQTMARQTTLPDTLERARLDPRAARDLARTLHHVLGDTGDVGVLWANVVDADLINDYYIPLNKHHTPLRLHDPVGLARLLAPSLPGQSPPDLIRRDIEEQMLKAEAIVLPASPHSYDLTPSLTIAQYRAYLVDFLNDPGSPRYVIRERFWEIPGHQLLLLQKSGSHTRGLESLSRPYRETGIGPDWENPLCGPQGLTPCDLEIRQFALNGLQLAPGSYLDFYGQRQAQRLTETRDAGGHFLSRTLPIMPGDRIDVVLYINPLGRRSFRLQISSSLGTSGVQADIRLDDTDLGSRIAKSHFGMGTAVHASLRSLAFGWYRVRLAGYIDDFLTNRVLVRLDLAAAATRFDYPGDPDMGLLLAGIRLMNRADATDAERTEHAQAQQAVDRGFNDMMLLATLDGYNLVGWGEWYYIFPHALGPLSSETLTDPLALPGVIRDKSIAALIRTMESRGTPLRVPPQP